MIVQHPSLNGEVVYQKIKQEGILVRHFNTPGIENFVRISIGTKEQMDKLDKVLNMTLGSSIDSHYCDKDKKNLIKKLIF